MGDRLRRRLTYSNVMATVAVFVALGGSSYAALTLPKNSVGARQLKANAVSSSKVKDSSLRARDFKHGELPAGAAGPQGPKGDRGEAGAPGAPGEQGPAGPGAKPVDLHLNSAPDKVTIATVGPWTLKVQCANAPLIYIDAAGPYEYRLTQLNSTDDGTVNILPSNGTGPAGEEFFTGVATPTGGHFKRSEILLILSDSTHLVDVHLNMVADLRDSAAYACTAQGTVIPAG